MSRIAAMSLRPNVRAALLACAVTLVACGGHASGASTSSPAAGSGPAAVTASIPGADWTRFGFNAQHSGAGPLNTGITAGDHRSLRVRKVQIDGTVDSSAIELHAVRIRGRVRDVIVVTTTYGRTIAIDPGTGAKLWEYTPKDIAGYQGSTQIMDTTPVADPGRRYVYAASNDGMIRKLALATGREVRSAHWPVRITFDATHEKMASPLNISGKLLIAVTDGYVGDAPPYQGHVVTIDRASGRIVHIWNAVCSNRHYLIHPSSCSASDAAIWSRAGSVVEPGTNRILVATGNAPFNGSTNWGDSVLELTPDAARLLHNWTPPNQAQDNVTDTDVGSTAPVLLPPTGGFRLAVQGGKDAQLHLLNLNRLDGTTGGAGARLGGELSEISTPGGSMMFTAPAVWTHGGRTYVFVAVDGGTAAYTVTGGGSPRLTPVWQDSTPGTSPVVAGGILYVYDEVDGSLALRNPVNGHSIATLPAATGHWNSPIAVGGRIILPTGNGNDHLTSGTLYIYHLPGR
jgi:hypothetical protein